MPELFINGHSLFQENYDETDLIYSIEELKDELSLKTQENTIDQ